MRRMITGTQAEQIESNSEKLSQIQAWYSLSGSFTDANDYEYMILMVPTSLSSGKYDGIASYCESVLTTVPFDIDFENSKVYYKGTSDEINLTGADIYLVNMLNGEVVESFEF